MDVANVLRVIRDRTGWSQERLADRLDVSQAQISRWLAGHQPRGLNWEKVRGLALEYGVFEEAGDRLGGAPPEHHGVGGFAEEGPAVRSDVLQNAIVRVEQWLAEKHIALDPVKKARLVTLIYEVVVADEPRGAEHCDRRIQQILQLVA